MQSWITRLAGVPVFAVAVAYLHEGAAQAIMNDGRERSVAAERARREGFVVNVPARAGTEAPPLGPRVPDPDLESGFPVQAMHTAGTYRGGAVVHTLVGNIDRQPDLEIVVTGLATGPLYAWKYDGTPLAGWPVRSSVGAEYPVLGRLGRRPVLLPGFEVFSGGFGGGLAAWWGNGVLLPGWPRTSANYVTDPGSTIDLDGNGRDEIFIAEQDFALHGYRADGTPLPGWPVDDSHGDQQRHTPAIADLDGDGSPDMITVTGNANSIAYILAYSRSGSILPGFPVALANGHAQTFPVVGDVDGDDEPEIVLAMQKDSPPWDTLVRVFSHTGAVERTLIPAQKTFYGTAPALADLDDDGLPEIIVATNGALDVWKGDGSSFPGWPRTWGPFPDLVNSAPVVGDVDGDGQPDIVITSNIGGGSDGEVRMYDRFGNLHPRFPKVLPIGGGAVPAIADIDRDGRNEIVVSGDFWNGFEGMYDKVWVYDLGGGPHGPVLWGQFMGGPQHQGRYVGPQK